MNMHNITQNLHSSPLRLLAATLAFAGLCFPGWEHGMAQTSPRASAHFLYDYKMPPGEIGFRKTLARHAMVGYFQPLQFKGPEGTTIEVFSEGSFRPMENPNQAAGLMVGHIYRLKISNIPGQPGRELFPSVEVMGRLFPPVGQENFFPIPVNIEMDDLDPAAEGALVTRVVYLENPRNTIAEQRTRDDQPFFDVGTAQDPIRAAEKLGRPMVILRIGSRIPDANELNAFGFGTPPMIWVNSKPVTPINPEAALGRDRDIRQVQWENQTNSAPPRLPALNASGAVAMPTYGAPATQQQMVAPGCPSQYGGPCNCGPGYAIAQPNFPRPLPWPDEVLIDGGDRDLGVVVKDLENRWEIRGLDTEDTVAHYNSLDGCRCIEKSNRVAIYAPRFSAVRKLDYLGRTQYTNLIGSVDEEIATTASQRTEFSSTTLQNLQPRRHQHMTQVVAVENMTRSVPVENVTPIKLFDGRFKTYENLRAMKTGVLENREKGRLSIGIQKALSWASDVSAQSTDGKLQIIVVDDVRKPREFIHIERKKGCPPLRLIKIASADTAHPGDYVDFTIRFDNMGDQPIGNVTIMDNLTSRLSYVDGTAECSLPGEFKTEPNGEGSLILSWEIKNALPATKGGVIRFRCRVR
ncbi:MAG: hypothetical protein P8J33_04385 [Pirellulaceae bacterium]|nr:hypothetical protein [Pirellulaceae bacterium]